MPVDIFALSSKKQALGQEADTLSALIGVIFIIRCNIKVFCYFSLMVWTVFSQKTIRKTSREKTGFLLLL